MFRVVKFPIYALGLGFVNLWRSFSVLWLNLKHSHQAIVTGCADDEFTRIEARYEAQKQKLFVWFLNK